MFFLREIERNVQLHPRYFRADFRDRIVSQLIQDVQGSFSARYGYIIKVTRIVSIGRGSLGDGTGYSSFPVRYEGVVFRLFKGEILQAVVTKVNQFGFWAEAGPAEIFVYRGFIPDNMDYEPGGIESLPRYTTADGSVKIQKDSEVRVKIIGTRVKPTEIECIGTIKGDFLG